FRSRGTRQGAYTGAGESVFDLGDIFSDLFGSAGAGAPGGGPGGARSYGRMRGRDIRFPLDIDFLDAVKGAKRRVQLAEGRTLDVSIASGAEPGQALPLQ